jgi:pilus assembly protein CpaE
MSEQTTNILLAHDASISGDWVIEHIPQENDVTVREVMSSLSTRSEALKSSNADVLVIACSNESDAALDLVEWWVENGRNRPVVVLCQNSPNGFVQRAFSVGADDLVVLEPGPEISESSTRNVGFALQKAIARRKAPGKPEANLGTMICVLGPKGGIGKTVTCCNLSLSLATMRHRVALVDLDLQFGDVALSLGMRPERTIYDLVGSGGSLDADKIEAYMTVHQTGLRVLAAPVRPDQAGVVTPDFITGMIASLRTAYDFVVIDTPPSFGPEVIAAIDASSHLCVIGMLDSLSLKNTRLGLETLDLMGYPPERIRVVLNRANTNVGITGEDVISVLGRRPEILIPSSRDLTRSVNQGDPIVLSQKRSEAARAFNALALLFAPPPKLPRRGARNRIRLGRSRG